MEKIRRYDLDWLRVIVFGLLIFYHVGMFFVPWGWHIKNNETHRWLIWPMLFLNQWRLPILFVISGMGTYFALSHRSGWQFAKERWLRLGLPLLVGMLFIVPPQVYLERIANGQFEGDYLTYWTTVAFDGAYPSGNISWHHLWFLPYLLLFSLLLIPVFLMMRRHPQNRLTSWLSRQLQKNPYHVYWLVLPLFVYEAALEPFFDVTHALIDDWFNFISSMTLFFYGFLLMTVKDEFFAAISRIRKPTVVIGLIAFGAMVSRWLFIEDGLVVHLVEAMLKVVNFWSWILAIFGFAAAYFHRSSPLLTYCNRAVYPFYILHQTITIIIAYYLMDLSWGLFAKYTVLLVGTFGFSFLLYELLIRRIVFLRPLFGLKWRG